MRWIAGRTNKFDDVPCVKKNKNLDPYYNEYTVQQYRHDRTRYDCRVDMERRHQNLVPTRRVVLHLIHMGTLGRCSCCHMHCHLGKSFAHIDHE